MTYRYENQDGSFYALWEAGKDAPMPAPLAVRDPCYREALLKMFMHFDAATSPGTLISLGCGNGFMERVLQQAGYDVLATDISNTALHFARQKGLKTRKLDIAVFPETFETFDVVYADGLAGHTWCPNQELAVFSDALARLCATHGMIVLSNDLSDRDTHVDLCVRHDPNARFYRPPRGQFAHEIVMRHPSISLIKADVYTYLRHGRTLRRREIIILRKD